jgi:hypothetical protein
MLVPVPANEGRISQANCDRVQVGGTLAEVRDILGEPSAAGSASLSSETYVWIKEDGSRIHVTFENGVVVEKNYTPVSVFDLLIRRIWPWS